MSQEREFNQEDNGEQMDKNSPGYYKWLAERSCSEYIHVRKQGFIFTRQQPEKVDYMFSKKIKMLLYDNELAIILVTEDGEVYHWRELHNSYNFDEPKIEYYSQAVDLSNIRIVQTATGGNSTFIALTEDERVYYFETKCDKNSHFGWMRRMNFERKIICISCGGSFFVVITDDHKVYTWGINNRGQLGNSTCTDEFIEEPREIKFVGNKIVRVACGLTHTLALSDKGNIFAWGGNVYGELGFDHREDIPSPMMVTVTPKPMKILDIAAMRNMSSAIAENKLIYVWGSCFDQQIRKPIACEYTTVFDMSNALSARPPTTVKYLNADERSNVLKVFADAFNDPIFRMSQKIYTDSDLVIKIEEQSIYVHKIVLQIRSSYFKNIVRFITSENDQDVIRLDQFSYVTYYAFFKYLYTGNIDLTPEEKFDLLTLAEAFKESKLEKSCYEAIKKEITIANVISIYNMAKRYNRMIVQKYCFEVCKENMQDEDASIKLDEKTKNIFMEICGFFS